MKGICAKTGKVKYGQAWQAGRALKRLNNAGLGIYRCRSCGEFHVGHETSRTADRIAQLLNKG